MPPVEVVKAAMIVGAIPAPPLPMLVCKEVPDELSFVDGDTHVANTHDLLAVLLLRSMEKAGDEKAQEERAKMQGEAVEALFAAVRAVASDEKAGTASFDEVQTRVYNAFCTFTRSTIAALSGKVNVCFRDLASIKRDDKIHLATTQHAVIQDLAFGYLPTDPPSARYVRIPFPYFHVCAACDLSLSLSSLSRARA